MTITISVPCQGVCTPWATPDDVCEPCSEPGIVSNDLLVANLQIASDILFELSGRQYAGYCSDVVRPVLRSLARDYGRPIRSPWPFGGPYGFWPPAGLGNWSPSSGFWMVNRTDRSGGQIIPEITLGVYPLVAVTEILIDGVALPRVDPVTGVQNWRIDDNRWLVRMADPTTTDNPGWPGFQRHDLPPTEPNTWQVSLVYGVGPPPDGVRAAARLACELALLCNPETASKCRLPQRVTSVTRQGTTMVILDPWTFLDKGRTGLYDVDLFLIKANPAGLRRRATVSSPDISRRVRRPTG